MAKYTSIGGQALIEGIMMKSPEKTAMAIRTPDKNIDITYLEGGDLRKKYKILNVPVLRGVIAFAESMINGYKALMISADKSGFTELEEDKTKEQLESEKKKQNVLVGSIMVAGTVLGVALAIVLFMLLPRLIVGGLEFLFKTEFPKLVRSIIEQALKLAVFVAYVWLVSFMNDIKRVFMYHGAEHKTIFCYEKGLALTVENVRAHKRFHPRCGTSFLILMILVSVIVSTVVQIIFPGVYNFTALWVATKILLVPLICGIGFEILKICGKYDNVVTRIISAPGLWLQRITTKEPDDSMIEIAIAALKACEPKDPDVERSVDKDDCGNDFDCTTVNDSEPENPDETAIKED